MKNQEVVKLFADHQKSLKDSSGQLDKLTKKIDRYDAIDKLRFNYSKSKLQGLAKEIKLEGFEKLNKENLIRFIIDSGKYKF